MTITEACQRLIDGEIVAFRLPEWERDNAFVAPLGNTFSLSYYFYGNVRVGAWYADATDLVRTDYEVVDPKQIGI